MSEWRDGDTKPEQDGLYMRHRTTCSLEPFVEYSRFECGVWYIEACYEQHARLETRVSNYQNKPWRHIDVRTDYTS